MAKIFLTKYTRVDWNCVKAHRCASKIRIICFRYDHLQTLFDPRCPGGGAQAVLVDMEKAQAALEDQNEQLQQLDQHITVLQGDIQKADAKKGHLKCAMPNSHSCGTQECPTVVIPGIRV